jgi:hypothetical protein
MLSEEELNKYRLTSMEEPTDEMLAQLWHEVAVEAKRKSEEAYRKLFQEIADAVEKRREEEKEQERR